LMSTVTLSVSTMATTSPSLTACPTAAIHSTIVPCNAESCKAVSCGEYSQSVYACIHACTCARRIHIHHSRAHITHISHTHYRGPEILTSVMESPMLGTGMVRFSSTGSVADTNPLPLLALVRIRGDARSSCANVHWRECHAAALQRYSAI
jgi:hypothetical protein